MRKRRNPDGEPSEKGGTTINDRNPSPPPDTGAAEDMVLLGRIMAAHGLKGEVKILTFTEVPENIGTYGPLSTRDGRSLTIETLRPQKGEMVVARLAEASNRTAAEALCGTELFVHHDCLPAPGDEEWYYSDLVGLKAVSPDGATLGEVIAVQNFGAGDLLEIRMAGGKRTTFVAFTRANVPLVDLTAGHMTVILPEEDISPVGDEDERNG